MERDTKRLNGGDHVQGSNTASVLNSDGPTVKINSLCIDLGIFREKDNLQKCSHFSIRGYVAKMRERSGKKYLPFAMGSEETPPIEVPHFKYWRCQSCLQDCGAAYTSQQVSLVSQNGKKVVQPCATTCHSLDCHGSAIIPFGEGTSGLKPVDKRSNDKHTLPDSQRDIDQSSPEIQAVVDVPKEVGKIDSADIEFVASGIEENNLRDHEDQYHVGLAKGALSCPVFHPMVQSVVHSDQQNDDPSGHPRRKARKVRLLTELLRGRTKEHQRNENNNTASVLSPSSSQVKRKAPQALDQLPVGKKLKTAKTRITEHSRDLAADEGEHKTDDYQCNKQRAQRSDPMVAWRSIFSDIGQPDPTRPVLAANVASRGKGSDPMMAPPHPEKKSNASMKAFDSSCKNHYFREDFLNLGGSGVRNHESDERLGLDLSLHYDPQAHVCSRPPLPNRVPVLDHSRKAGFFYGEPSINHRVILDHQAKERPVYEQTPRTAFLPEHHHQHYRTHPSFSQHQNLDFSDPHNKRNGGFRAYSDVMRANNHQRQEMFSYGRSDEKEIIELMAKIQHERNNNNNDNGSNGLLNKSSFRKVNLNKPIPRYPSGFFHQEQAPAFPMFDMFSQYQNHPSTRPPRRQNLHYYDSSRGHNVQIMEALNKYRDGTQKSQTPRNVWSNIPTSVSFGHKNKGKNIMNLDLNVTAPNVVEEHKGFDTFEMNQIHTGYLDSSYSNEAIPAMQLLSLMDAGKSNSSFTKPFSPCHNHGASPSSAVPNSFSSFIQTDKKTFETHSNGHHFFHKPQQNKPPTVLSSSSITHKYRPDGSTVFPAQDQSGPVAKQGLGSLRTGACTINRNPADFSTPGPENVYMISANDLVLRGERCYKSRFASERQKR